MDGILKGLTIGFEGFGHRGLGLRKSGLGFRVQVSRFLV